MRRSRWIASATAALVVAGMFPAGARQTPAPAVCAPPAAADPMPEGSGHDHSDPAQHQFACGVELVAYRGLTKEIPEPMQFGEVDVAHGIAVMATSFPEAGFVVFDVSNPRNPVFRSRFRSTRCELETDVDCGADVKLHPTKPLAFLALQRSLPSKRRPADRIPTGIAVVDLTDPAQPKLVSFLALPPAGVHLVSYHEIAGVGYVFARIRVQGRGDLSLPPDADPAIGPGFGIYRLDGMRLVRISEVRTQDSHDVSLFDDPVDHRTYLCVSGGRSSSLFLYDVTDPLRPRRLGSWTPPDDRSNQGWYIHDATMFRRDGERFVVLGAEQFKAEPFHGDAPGTVWMLDVARLDAPQLLGKWSNPGRHHAGDLVNSTHTSSYTDGFTWTAHYHGGVWLLDWRNVIAGAASAPVEAGSYVPHESRRPFVINDKVDKPFISAPIFRVRPLIWDAFFSGGYAYVSDINGGLYVLARSKPKAAPKRSGGFPVGVVVGIGGSAVIAAWGSVARRRRRTAG
jgi:hypothetical protein